MVVISLWTLFDPFGKKNGKTDEIGEGTEPGGARDSVPNSDARQGEGAAAAVAVGTGTISWRGAPARTRWGLTAGFFVVGVYGGFVQAGVGFLVLAATSIAGFDLVRGNAVKGVAIFFLSVLALVMFASQGQVDWITGLALAAGMVAGSQLGVHLTVLKGHRWVRGVVTAAILVFAVKLWLD